MTDHLIMCDKCKVWYCHKCAEVNVKLIDVLVECKELCEYLRAWILGISNLLIKISKDFCDLIFQVVCT